MILWLLPVVCPELCHSVCPNHQPSEGRKNLWWTGKEELAFVQLKTILCHAPMLRALDFIKQFKLMSDASDIGSGAVLM